MFNAFVVKKYAALVLVSMLAVVSFAVGSVYYGIFVGIGCMMVSLLVGMVIGNLLLKNPFTMMLEGKGILVIDFCSTGILRPFIVGVNSSYIQGKVMGEKVEDVFDRDAIMQLAIPRKAKVLSRFSFLKKLIAPKTSLGATPTPLSSEQAPGGELIDDDRKVLKFELDEDEYNDARFALYHWPVIFYNSQLKAVVTKSWLASEEKNAFAKHGILYLNRKVEELTSSVRDFGRYVVETLKPKSDFFKSKWFIIIVIVVVAILAALFLPAIVSTVQGFTEPAGKALSSAADTGRAVMPR